MSRIETDEKGNASNRNYLHWLLRIIAGVPLWRWFFAAALDKQLIRSFWFGAPLNAFPSDTKANRVFVSVYKSEGEMQIRRRKRITYGRIKSCRKTATDNSLGSRLYCSIVVDVDLFYYIIDLCNNRTHHQNSTLRHGKLNAKRAKAQTNSPAGMNSCVFLSRLVSDSIHDATATRNGRLQILLTTTRTYLFLVVLFIVQMPGARRSAFVCAQRCSVCSRASARQHARSQLFALFCLFCSDTYRASHRWWW